MNIPNDKEVVRKLLQFARHNPNCAEVHHISDCCGPCSCGFVEAKYAANVYMEDAPDRVTLDLSRLRNPAEAAFALQLLVGVVLVPTENERGNK